MWGKVPFKARKPSGGDHRPTTTRTFQPSPPIARDVSAKALPTIPAGSSHFLDQPQPNPRVPSSVYSRDTVVFDHHRDRSISDTYQFPPQLDLPDSNYASGTRSVEISPPDSPISRPLSQASGRVSPIEEVPARVPKVGGSYPTHPASQIPVYQKPTQSKPTRANATKWDTYSGEPTTSNRGKTGQVNPSKVSFETHVSGPRHRSNSSKILDWGKEQLQSHSRKKTSESRSQYYVDNITPFAPREPWRGQNGRSAVISPIEEDPRPGPGNRTRSSSRLRLARSSDKLREMNTPSPPTVLGKSATFTTTITAGEQNLSSFPLTRPRQQPKRSQTPTQRPAPTPRPEPAPNVYDYDAPKSADSRAGSYGSYSYASRNASAVSIGGSGTAPPRVDLVQSSDLSASLTDLTLSEDDEVESHTPKDRSQIQTPEPEFEPTSRFSVTTYNTTIAGSPTHSREASITPSPPASILETASQSSEAGADGRRSIMSRSRPVPSAIAPGKQRPVRKPTPSEVPSLTNTSTEPNTLHMSASERISHFENKRTALIKRRNNINTIINELTQVIQPSSIAYDMAAHEEVKKTVASLNKELAEIGKEEHELGLKLLRLWKRREDEDFYGQSGTLWVKRATS